MNHVKELELLVLAKLSKCKEILYKDFQKHFSDEKHTEIFVVVSGLFTKQYIFKGNYGEPSYDVFIRIEDKGKLYLSELRKEKHEQEVIKTNDSLALDLNKGANIWNKVAAISGVIAALTSIFAIWLAYNTPIVKRRTITDSSTVIIASPIHFDDSLKIDSANAQPSHKGKNMKAKLIYDCCTSQDSLEPKPPEVK